MVLLTIGPFKIQTTPPPKKHQKNTKKRQKQDAKWTLLPEVEQFPTKYCSCPRKPQIGRGFCRCHHIMRGRQANQSSQSHPVGLFRLLSWPLQGKAQPLYPLPSNFLTESRTENTSDFLVRSQRFSDFLIKAHLWPLQVRAQYKLSRGLKSYPHLICTLIRKSQAPCKINPIFFRLAKAPGIF